MKITTIKLLALLAFGSFMQACSTIPKHTQEETTDTHGEHAPPKRIQPLGSEKRK